MYSTLLAAFFLISSTGLSIAAEGWITKESPHSVADTVAKFTAAVEGAGARVFAIVDHAAGAQSIGSPIADETVVIFGNPKLGTPLIAANAEIGLDLPLKVLVWDDGGTTRVGYLDPQALKARYGIAGADKVFQTMAGALGKLTGAAVAP